MRDPRRSGSLGLRGHAAGRGSGGWEGRCRGRGPDARARGARADPPVRAGPRPRRGEGAPARAGRRQRLRRAVDARWDAAAARPGCRVESGVGHRCRLRPAPAVLRRSFGRGDLGQRAEPCLRRPARGRRADDDPALARPGPRPRGADAEVLGPPGGPVLAVRGCRAPRREPAARRHPRHHEGPLVRQRAQVRRQGRLDGRPRQAGNPHAAGGPLPRGRGRVRAQRARRRRDASREDDPPELPGLGRAGSRADRDLRGGLRAAHPAPRRRRDAVPPAVIGGDGRDPAAPPGQGGAADAARRASSSARSARPRASTCSSRSTPVSRACARSTRTAPARPSPRCARCRCWPARTSSARFVVPTVAASIDLVVHAALERDGRRTVREIAAVPGRVEGDVVEIADVFVRRGGELCRADGFPPHADRFERAGYDLSALLAQGSP